MNISQKSRLKISSWRCFGVDLSRDKLAVSIVYFVQGVLGLARLAVSFYLKDDLNLDPAEASFMPVLVLAARLCPSAMEATLFATLMSISNGVSVAGGLLGAGLTQLLGVMKDSFNNLPLLTIICNVSSLLPLPLLGLLPKDTKNMDIEQTKLRL